MNDDGVYLEAFVLKDGVRLNCGVISLRKLVTEVTSSVCDAFEKALSPDKLIEEQKAGR